MTRPAEESLRAIQRHVHDVIQIRPDTWLEPIVDVLDDLHRERLVMLGLLRWFVKKSRSRTSEEWYRAYELINDVRDLSPDADLRRALLDQRLADDARRYETETQP